MRKISAYNFISLNGYYKGINGDISWNKHDEEENDYAATMLGKENTLLFGRVTYEMMAGYWPTPDAIKHNSIVAEGMNNADKIVFSRTLKKAEWTNTTLIKENLVEEIQKMKQSPGKDLTVLGSGSIITQLAEKGLIDEYQIMLNPVVLANGTSMFKGIEQTLELTLTTTRTFKNGNILLCYQPAILVNS